MMFMEDAFACFKALFTASWMILKIFSFCIPVNFIDRIVTVFCGCGVYQLMKKYLIRKEAE